MHAILVTPHETNKVSAVWGERAREGGCVSETRYCHCEVACLPLVLQRQKNYLCGIDRNSQINQEWRVNYRAS